MATDTLGNMLTVQVHAAHMADTRQGGDVCDRVVEKYDSVEAFSGDQGYQVITPGRLHSEPHRSIMG